MPTRLRKRIASPHAPLSCPSRRRVGEDGSGRAKPVYELSLQFDVRSALQLWHAAARRLRESGLSPPDIETTIGLAADPSIPDCLATLILPRHASGCDLLDVRIGPALPVDDPFADRFPILSEH